MGKTTSDRLKRYASMSAYLHIGISVIGAIVLIVLLIVTSGHDFKESIKDYGKQNVD